MKARGFTLLEFVVVVVIIGILGGLLLSRVVPLMARAERVAFEQLKSQVHSALLLEAAERITRGEAATLGELTAVNPMSLLLQPPGNYLGEVKPDGAEQPSATWYFDRRDRLLVYKLGRYAKFESEAGPSDRIELAVEFIYRDRDGDDRFNPSADHFDGFRLESVYAYEWTN